MDSVSRKQSRIIVQDSFDPYLEWLDLRSAERPPDHYSLLDIQRFESDLKVIAHAADVRMAQVRKIRPGEHLPEWGRLLDQLNAAKVCLSNPVSKAAYDASLRDQESTRPAPSETTGLASRLPTASVSPPPQPTGVPPQRPGAPPAPIQSQPQQLPQTPADVSAPRTAAAAAPIGAVVAWLKKMRENRLVTVAVVSLLAAGFVGAFAYVLKEGLRPRVEIQAERPEAPLPPAAAPGVVAKAPDKPAVPETPPGPQPQPGQPSPQEIPVKPRPATDVPEPTTPAEPTEPGQPPKPEETIKQPEPPQDAKQQAAFDRAVSDARLAMSQRDLAAARRHLEAATLNAQTTEDQTQLARLQTMLGHLDEFWVAMRDGVSTLNGGRELALKTTRVVVVEADRDRLTVRAAGANHSWTLRHLPASVVRAVVNESFPRDATSKLQLGTFLAFDADGDRLEARQLWEEAAQEGIDVDALLPELDVALPSGAGGEPKISPVADRNRLRQAEQSVRQLFEKNYAEAASNVKKIELAKELLARAAAAGDDPAARFVMFREARDLAADSGKPALACEAVDQMAKSFTIDAIPMKTQVLEAAADKTRGLIIQREIALTALRLVDQAAAAGRLEEAERLATLAVEAARKSRSPALIRQAVTAAQRVQSRQNRP